MTSSSSPGPQTSIQLQPPKPNQVGTVMLYGIPIVSLMMESTERLCLAQISNTLLKDYSYNEIHNRRVALGITCVQCTPVQLEMLRRAGAMPVSSRRCGMITRREAERLCKSFLGDNSPPRLPEDFAFAVHHSCAWGCTGSFIPSRYNSSRAKCIKCTVCGLFFSPNKFIFHSHRTGPQAKYVQPDAANFNSWRRHMRLSGSPPEAVIHAWEDVKAMFNGGTRKRLVGRTSERKTEGSPRPPPSPRVPPLPLVVDWFKPYYPLPWLPPAPLLLPDRKTPYTSAFTPVSSSKEDSGDETVDIETCPEDDVKPSWSPPHLTQKNDAVSPSSPKATQISRSESPNPIPERKAEEGSEVWRYGFSPSSYNMARHLHLIKELSVPALTNRDQISVVYPPPPTDLSLNDKNYGPLDCSTCSQISPYPPVLPVPLRHPTQPN